MRLVDKYPVMLTAREATILYVTAANALDPAAAESAGVNVRAIFEARPKEELDKSDRRAFEFAHLRIAQEITHVRRVKARVELHAARQDDQGRAARILVDVGDYMLDHLEMALARSQGGRGTPGSGSTELPDLTLEPPEDEKGGTGKPLTPKDFDL